MEDSATSVSYQLSAPYISLYPASSEVNDLCVAYRELLIYITSGLPALPFFVCSRQFGLLFIGSEIVFLVYSQM